MRRSTRACCATASSSRPSRTARPGRKSWKCPSCSSGSRCTTRRCRLPAACRPSCTPRCEDPDNRDTVDLLAEMVSDEIFVYGDKQIRRFRRLFQIVNTDQELCMDQGADQRRKRRPVGRASPGRGDALGTGAEREAERHPQRGRRFQAEEHQTGQRATRQVRSRSPPRNSMPTRRPRAASRKPRSAITNTSCSLSALGDPDGSLGTNGPTKLKEMRGQREATPRRSSIASRNRRVVVALCVRDNYFLVSVGSSLEGLEKLGKGDRLIDRARAQAAGEIRR